MHPIGVTSRSVKFTGSRCAWLVSELAWCGRGGVWSGGVIRLFALVVSVGPVRGAVPELPRPGAGFI